MQSFLVWLDYKKEDLSTLIYENSSKPWEGFLQQEFRQSRDSAKDLQAKRLIKLKKDLKKKQQDMDLLLKYKTKTKIWVEEIQTTECNMFMAYKQDYLTTQTFVAADWEKLSEELSRERSLWGPTEERNVRWKLDFLEARARMRKKLRRNLDAKVHYLSKSEKIEREKYLAQTRAASKLASIDSTQFGQGQLGSNSSLSTSMGSLEQSAFMSGELQRLCFFYQFLC